MNLCEKCNCEITKTFGSGRFCNKSCASSFSTSKNRKKINKKISRTLRKRAEANKKPPRRCISCGDLSKTSKSKYCLSCNKLSKDVPLFKKLGVLESNLNNSKLLAIEKLKDLYFNQKLTGSIIRKLYGIQSNTLFFFFRKNGMRLRSLSESQRVGLEEGRINLPSQKTYRSGWHTAWNNKKVYLRSQLEFDFAKQLDEKKIYYEVESLRIRYYDSQKKKERIALPDFYLPKENKIVEIKSDYFLDSVNMKDKEKAYRASGYNFELIVL